MFAGAVALMAGDWYRPFVPAPAVDSPSGGPMPNDDAWVVRALAQGDRTALASLYDRFGPLMLAVGQKVLGSTREAEDLLHDVFLEAWRAAKDFDPARGSVRTWLMLRMRSRAVDRVRARKRAKVVLDPEGQPPEVATAMPDPSATAERTRVRAAIAELPENERQVLELVYFGGMTHAEVAEAHSIPLGTVKSRVARAIRHLRTSMRSSDEASKGEHDDS